MDAQEKLSHEKFFLQVARSVGVAEQLGAAKAEAEFEAAQLRSQVERQQGRIRGLIEEQCAKVEEERAGMERRWREQVEASRREAASLREEASRTSRELERLTRAEVELKQVAEDRERTLAKVRGEMEKKAGELQLEIVQATGARQTAERDVNAIRLRGERELAEIALEKESLQAEVESVRGRLRGTEEALVNARKEQVELVERVAGLEVELAGEKRRREGLERRRGEEVAEAREVRDAEAERCRREAATREKRQKRDQEQLEGMIRRQSRVIGELRAQCEAVTSRFEASHGDWKNERERLASEVRNLRSRESQLAQEVEELVHRGEDQSKVHQKLLSQLQLQVERSPPGGRLNHQSVGGRVRTEFGGRESQMGNPAGGQNESPVGRMRRVAAITVEREGKVRHLLTNLPPTNKAASPRSTASNGFVY